MSDDRVYKKLYTEVGPINEREVWRYAGYAGIPADAQDELREVFHEVVNELKNSFNYQVCYRRLKINWTADSEGKLMPELPFTYESKNLADCLNGSDEVLFFAATIGPDIDKKILLYEKISPTKALIAQAYGAERIESLCDLFCEEIRSDCKTFGKSITARFSPGYGDWKLEVQKEFFSELDIYHQIGVALGDSLLMRPSKSVTAIFGIKDSCVENNGEPSEHEKNCLNCNKLDCEFRNK